MIIFYYTTLSLTIIWGVIIIFSFSTGRQNLLTLSGFLGIFLLGFLWLIVFLWHNKLQYRIKVTKDFAPAIEFSEAQMMPLPKETSWAKKRGFGDFNGDNLEDMIEIRDEAWLGQDFRGYIFYGQKNEQGLLSFQEKAQAVKFPTKLKWWSTQTKLDVGDVNGDGYCDIIFSQYKEGIWEDNLNFAFALNNQAEEFFLAKSEVLYDERSFTEVLINNIHQYASDDDSTIDDWLKMDWADMNGDGSDDFVMMWLSNELEVMYTQVADSQEQTTVLFQEEGYFETPYFITGRDIRNFDTEDFDGDGKADLFIQDGKRSLSLTVSLNRSEFFESHKDFKTFVPSTAFFSFYKFDTFDVNLDGKADLVKLGKKGGKPVLYYLLVK